MPRDSAGAGVGDAADRKLEAGGGRLEARSTWPWHGMGLGKCLKQRCTVPCSLMQHQTHIYRNTKGLWTAPCTSRQSCAAYMRLVGAPTPSVSRATEERNAGDPLAQSRKQGPMLFVQT